MKLPFPLLLGALVSGSPGLALAHIQLDEPTRRQTDVDGPGLAQKTGPCGSNARSGNVSVFEPGQTITVAWHETIGHPGHFRISFDNDGQDAFADPTCLTNCSTMSSPTFELFPDSSVLDDGIADQAGSGTYSVQVTLPDVECENCTLQLIQVMYDKPPYTTGSGSNDMYYQCADLALRRPGGAADAGAPASDTGGQSADAGSGPPILEDAGGSTADAGTGGGMVDAGAGVTSTDASAPDDSMTRGEVESGGGCSASGVSRSRWATFAMLGLVLLIFRRRR